MEGAKEKRLEELKMLKVQSPAELRKKSASEISLPATWKPSGDLMGMVEFSLGVYNTKHGLYSAIPMMCQGERCSFAQVCPLMDTEEMDPTGGRCPLEIALIMKRYDEYVEEFGIDEENVVDMGMVKDLIDYDIQLMRAENKIAIQGDFVEDNVVGVNDKGQEITNKQLSNAVEYKDKIQNKKYKALQLMHSTRADKAGDKLTVQLDPSTYAAQLMAQAAQNMAPGQIFDEDDWEEGEWEEVEEDSDE